MLSYDVHFSSHRPDGRFTSTLAAHMAMMRASRPSLALPDNLTAEQLPDWQEKVRNRLRGLLNLPDFTLQPEPVLLSSVQREGYRVEKWEFYPDDYTAVPYLALIPDGASPAHPVPAVLCMPGSNHSKEMLAGEPQDEHPNCAVTRYPERNRMAQYIVQNGMAAFAFDNPAIGECSVLTDPALGQTQGNTRIQLCYGLLCAGQSYPGLAVFQKLCFMRHLDRLDYVDQDRLALCGHSLGTETALYLGLLSNRFKALVFNDFLCDGRRHYTAITEEPEDAMTQHIGDWHIVPGLFDSFSLPDLCAAFAPGWLALNEGGADEFLNTVRRAYRLAGHEERLQITHYPAFSDPETRTIHGPVPDHGLSSDDFYRKYSYCIPEDHSFRQEPSLRLLKQCFGL